MNHGTAKPITAFRAHSGSSLKFMSNDDAGLFEALCVSFGNTNSYGDTFQPGAFAKTLSQHKAEGRAVPLLWNHDRSQPIGKWISLRESSDGLVGLGKLCLDTRKGREALALAKEAAIGLSVCIRCEKTTALADGRQRMDHVRLSEISLVASPSDAQARITSVMDIGEREVTRSDLSEFLRDAGLSRRFVTALLRSGFAAADIASTRYDAEVIAEIKARARAVIVRARAAN